MSKYQTIADCNKYHSLLVKILGLIFLMMGGIFWVTLDARTISAETKGEVSQIKWVVESHLGVDPIATVPEPWMIAAYETLKEKSQ